MQVKRINLDGRDWSNVSYKCAVSSSERWTIDRKEEGLETINCLRETLRIIGRGLNYIYSQHAHYLSWLPYNVLYIEMVKLITFNVESKENLALKGRLSNSATITKQINARKNSPYYDVMGGQGPWCV